MSRQYDDYLGEHKANVRIAFDWLKEHCSELIHHLAGDSDLENIIAEHDKSKTNLDEFLAYDAYFYGNNKSYSVVNDFNNAWLLHIHRNPHHWQHWVLMNDDPKEGIVAVDMPNHYIIEMICDWWSFSWRNDNLFSIFDWYEEHSEYMKLSEKTRRTVEYILDMMKLSLERERGTK